MELGIDFEDLEDLLWRIEESFDIKFEANELDYVKTYGEFCDAIKEKIKLDHSDNCTTQQAFHKLREAITSSSDLVRNKVSPSAQLKYIFPRKSRKARIKKIEKQLGFNLSILRPPHFVTWFLVLLFIASLVGLAFAWQYGLVGLGLSIGGIWISDRIGIELNVKTVGDLSEKMTRENYLKSRRNLQTINKNELDKVLEEWFVNFLGIRKSELKREARLT